MPRNRKRKKIRTNKTLSPEEEHEKLVELCKGEFLTLSELCKKLEACPEETIRAHGEGDTLLHYACYNRRVTLDIVKYLVDRYPEAVKRESIRGLLPLHRACHNERCPDEVVKFLVSEYPEALRIPWDLGGLPLHCILARFDKENYRNTEMLVGVDVVRFLVDKFPEALTNQDNRDRNTPLLIACARESSLELLQVLVDSERIALSLTGTFDDCLPFHKVFDRGDRSPCPPVDVVKFFLENSPENALNVPDKFGDTPFHTACNKCNVSLGVIQLFVNKRPDLVEQVTHMSHDMLSNVRNLPLHSLCMNDHIKDEQVFLETVEYLVKLYPTAVETANNYGILPLHYGCSRKKFSEAAKLLINQHPESVQLPTGNTGALPIHYASSNGTLDLVKFLYDLYPESLSEKTFAGELPLHKASASGTADVIRFLIEKYPTGLEISGGDGNLPLHYLCRYHNQDLKLIRDAFYAFPAAIHAKNNEGFLPLHSAFSSMRFYPKQDVVSFLIKQLPYGIREGDGEGRTPAHIVCSNSWATVEEMRRTINLWPDALKVNSAAHGLPIHVACERRLDLDIVKYLESRYPGSLGVCNASVGLPLECAEKREVFEYLLVKRYNPCAKRPPLHAIFLDSELVNRAAVADRLIGFFPAHARDIDERGACPLHLAVTVDTELDIIHKLIVLVPEAVDEQDSTGSLPLHYALRHQPSRDVVERLLEASPGSVSVTDNQNCSPLHVACRHGASLDIVSLLTSAYPEGAYAHDSHGCVPLHVACRHGSSLDVIRHLVGADERTVRLLDENNEMPLHKACRGGHASLVQYLVEKNMPSASEQNGSGMLPFFILSQLSGKNRANLDTPLYVETLWKLLLAHPEAIMSGL